jgi:hypothetical protein
MFLNTNGDEIHTRPYGCIAYCRTDGAKEHLDLRISLGQPLELILRTLNSFLLGPFG